MDSRSVPHTQCGFTLLELITVMAIAGILAAVAIPSYRYIAQTNRIAAEVNGLLGDLQFARSEAVKEGQTVTVCQSSDGATCTVNTSWDRGWLVFSDVNANATVNAGDIIMRVQKGFTGTDTFIANHTISTISFNREGFAVANGTGLTGGGALLTLHSVPLNSDATRCLSLNTIGMTAVVSTKNSGGTCT
jgi:type IV fimbrial biogenesis protein FimT